MHPESSPTFEYDYENELLDQLEIGGPESLTEEERWYMGVELQKEVIQSPESFHEEDEKLGEAESVEVRSAFETEAALERFATTYGMATYQKSMLLYRHDRLEGGQLYDGSGANISEMIRSLGTGSKESAKAVQAHHDMLSHFERAPGSAYKQEDWYDTDGNLNRTFACMDSDGWISYWSVTIAVEKPPVEDWAEYSSDSGIEHSSAPAVLNADGAGMAHESAFSVRTIVEAFFAERSSTGSEARFLSEQERFAPVAAANDVAQEAVNDDQPAALPQVNSMHGITLRRTA